MHLHAQESVGALLREPCKTKSSSDPLVGASTVCPNHSFIIIEVCNSSNEVNELYQAHWIFLRYMVFSARDF